MDYLINSVCMYIHIHTYIKKPISLNNHTNVSLHTVVSLTYMYIQLYVGIILIHNRVTLCMGLKKKKVTRTVGNVNTSRSPAGACRRGWCGGVWCGVAWWVGNWTVSSLPSLLARESGLRRFCCVLEEEMI
jgi:hypothetical protein